jgi:hypothetical protein
MNSRCEILTPRRLATIHPSISDWHVSNSYAELPTRKTVHPDGSRLDATRRVRTSSSKQDHWTWGPHDPPYVLRLACPLGSPNYVNALRCLAATPSLGCASFQTRPACPPAIRTRRPRRAHLTLHVTVRDLLPSLV